MSDLVLMPPVAFIIILAVTIVMARLLSALSFKSKPGEEATTKPYACGEESPSQRVQPDYSQFFPFAFFFTILHVIALVVATVPVETPEIFTLAFVYIVGAITSLFILFRK